MRIKNDMKALENTFSKYRKISMLKAARAHVEWAKRAQKKQSHGPFWLKIAKSADAFEHDLQAAKNPVIRAIYRAKWRLWLYGETRDLVELSAAGMGWRTALSKAEVACYACWNGRDALPMGKNNNWYPDRVSHFFNAVFANANNMKIDSRALAFCYANLLRGIVSTGPHVVSANEKSAIALLKKACKVEKAEPGFYVLSEPKKPELPEPKPFKEWLDERLKP